jgi:hypothetical protein
MTTVIIDEKTKAGKSLIEFLRHSKQAQIIDEKKPNANLLKSMKEAEEGKVIRAKDVNELLANLKA